MNIITHYAHLRTFLFKGTTKQRQAEQQTGAAHVQNMVVLISLRVFFTQRPPPPHPHTPISL